MRLKFICGGILAIISIFLIVNFVGAPLSYLETFNNCTQLSCQNASGPQICTCSEINISDDIYANDGLLSLGSLTQTYSNHSTQIPDGSVIKEVQLQVEWYVTDSSGADCYIEVYNTSWHNATTECPGTTDDNTTLTYNITNITTNETLAEDIGVRINYTRAGVVYLYVDLVTVNITYLPLFPLNSWDLTNSSSGLVISSGKKLNRNEVLNVSAYWSPYQNLSHSYVEYNSTGSAVNYSVSSFEGNYTNYTINFTDYTIFPLGGNFTVSGVYANDTFDQWNKTTDTRHFALWSHANVNLSFNTSSILNGSAVNLLCNVTDSNSSYGITGYNVSFWDNDSFIGWNTSNSSGLASYEHSDATEITNNTSLSLEFKCNITNQSSIFYNVSNMSENTSNLTVANVFFINVSENNTVYNKGENMTFSLLDTSNQTIQNVTWLATRIKTSDTPFENMLYSGNNDTFTYHINVSESTGSYIVRSNATKSGRTIIHNHSFNITDSLNVTIFYPANGSTYAPNTLIDFPQVLVQNIRNQNLSYEANVTLVCPNGNSTLEWTNQSYYTNTSFNCRSHTSEGQSFSVTVIVNDSYNNSGTSHLALSTTSSGDGESSGGGGGGGGGGSSGSNCTCTEWKTFNCGAGTCALDEVLQTRVCDPAGCEVESQCVYNPVCAGDMNFNISVNTEEVIINQGEEESILADITNTGDIPIEFNISLKSDCCSFNEIQSFELLAKESLTVPVTIHAKLTEIVGVYSLTINVTGYSGSDVIEKASAVKIKIIENPIINQTKALENKIQELEQKIIDLKESGVDTSFLDNKKIEIQSIIDNAFSSIDSDSPTDLKSYVDQANAEIENALQTIEGMKYIKLIVENRYIIILAVIIIIISTYLISQVFVPYYKLGKEINDLSKNEKALVKSRIETEKQYFKRIIDEKTFQTILVEGQGKILRIKGSLKTKKELRSSLLKTRLSPVHFFRWVSGKNDNKKIKSEKETTNQKKGKRMFKNILINTGLEKKPLNFKPEKKKKHFWSRNKKTNKN